MNASQTAVGGVLMQNRGEGLQPLAFLSKQLKPTEQCYSAYERELVVVAYRFLEWRHYQEGCPGGVTVIINHQALTHIIGSASSLPGLDAMVMFVSVSVHSSNPQVSAR